MHYTSTFLPWQSKAYVFPYVFILMYLIVNIFLHCLYIIIYQIVSNTCSILNVYLIIFSYHYMSSRFFVEIYTNFFSAFVKCMHFIFNTCNNVQYNPLFAWCCSNIKMKYSNFDNQIFLLNFLKELAQKILLCTCARFTIMLHCIWTCNCFNKVFNKWTY